MVSLSTNTSAWCSVPLNLMPIPLHRSLLLLVLSAPALLPPQQHLTLHVNGGLQTIVILATGYGLISNWGSFAHPCSLCSWCPPYSLCLAATDGLGGEVQMTSLGSLCWDPRHQLSLLQHFHTQPYESLSSLATITGWKFPEGMTCFFTGLAPIVNTL